MRAEIEAVVKLAKGLLEEEPARGLASVKTLLERLEAEPPGPRRARALAWLFLVRARLALKAGRLPEAYAAWLSGYAYARSVLDAEAFSLAASMEEGMDRARLARPLKRRKHRR